MFDNTHKLLLEILRKVEAIERRLQPRFTLEIRRAAWIIDTSFDPPAVVCFGENDMSIQTGATGVFVGSVTASDGSTVTTSNWSWSASDPSVTIANDPSDSTGATVDVTVPASDTETTFTLTASASATSTTEATPQSVTGSVSVTITPSSTPVTFTMNITQTS